MIVNYSPLYSPYKIQETKGDKPKSYHGAGRARSVGLDGSARNNGVAFFLDLQAPSYDGDF